jgi:hypothetical protein
MNNESLFPRRSTAINSLPVFHAKDFLSMCIRGGLDAKVSGVDVIVSR